MLFLVCFSCVEVYTYEEGHRCPDSDGSQSDSTSENVLLIKAETENSNHDFSRTTRKVGSHGVYNTFDLWSQNRTKSTRSDFIFKVVASKPERKTTVTESQTKHGYVTGLNSGVADTCLAQYKQMQNISRNSSVMSYKSTENQKTSDNPLRYLQKYDHIPSGGSCLPKHETVPDAEQQKMNLFPLEFQMNKATESMQMRMAFDYWNMVNMYRNFPNVQELHSQNLEKQVGNLGEKGIWNFGRPKRKDME